MSCKNGHPTCADTSDTTHECPVATPPGRLRGIRLTDPSYVCLTPGCENGSCRTCECYANALTNLRMHRADERVLHDLLSEAGAPVMTRWPGAGPYHGDPMDAPVPLVARVRWLVARVAGTEADAARLDWLCDEARFSGAEIGPLDVWMFIGERVNFPGDQREDFRVAIDAARDRAAKVPA